MYYMYINSTVHNVIYLRKLFYISPYRKKDTIYTYMTVFFVFKYRIAIILCVQNNNNNFT